MIKVMDVYNDLRDITDEVVRVFSLAGIQPQPSLVVGIANMVCLLRAQEKLELKNFIEAETKVRETLLYYAKASNYKGHDCAEILNDGGERARLLLESVN